MQDKCPKHFAVFLQSEFTLLIEIILCDYHDLDEWGIIWVNT